MSKVTEPFHHALKINTKKCIGCTRCMKVCPTEAIRIRGKKAVLLANRCVDCGECYRVCPTHAIEIMQDDFSQIFNYNYRIALVPAVFIGQFSSEISTRRVYAGLKELGFTHVYEVEHGVSLVKEAYSRFMADPKTKAPYISSYCPAIVRLVQTRFPTLVNRLITYKSPVDVASIIIRKRLTSAGIHSSDIGVFYITPCAAKIASIKRPVPAEEHSQITGVINMDVLFNKTSRILVNAIEEVKPINHQLDGTDISWSLTNGEASQFEGRNFAINGIQNSIEFLEKLENDEIPKTNFVEIRACNQGCAGGVLCSNNRFITVERLEKRAKKYKDRISSKNVMGSKSNDSKFIDYIKLGKIPPRSMLKLDDDIELAIQKAELLQQLEQKLPNINCGVCGAPSCKALALDVVNEKASIDDCIFLHDTFKKELEKIWKVSKK